MAQVQQPPAITTRVTPVTPVSPSFDDKLNEISSNESNVSKEEYVTEGNSPSLSPLSSVPSPTSNIQVIRKSSRAVSSVLLQSAIRPLGSRLIKASKPAPAGSPTLKPPDSVHRKCNVRPVRLEGINTYEINARGWCTRFLFATTEQSGWHPGEIQARQSAKQEPFIDQLSLEQTQSLVGEDVKVRDWAQIYDGKARRRPRYIYYFPGGGWQQPATDDHWKLCAHLAWQLSEKDRPTTVYLVSYPLAPSCPAAVTMPQLSHLYYSLFSPATPNNIPPCTHPTYTEQERPEIVFAGDSAGGNIALALTLHVLSCDPAAPAPDSMMLVSPAVDMRIDKAEVAQAAKKDPLLRKSFVDSFHKAWCGTIPPSDPLVSPIEGDMSLLAKKAVTVNGVIGTNDILAPDAQKLISKLDKSHVKGKWLVWEKQMHCFPLTFSYGLADGKEAVNWMISTLSEK